MKRGLSKQSKDNLGFLAALVLALLCLAGSLYHVRILLELEEHGVKVPALVVGFKRGARNASWSIYQFSISDGNQITAQDKFQQYIRGVEKGETVQVIYDRRDPSLVTADLGLWTWQAPIIFALGFLFLLVIAFLIRRHSKGLRE